MMCNRNKNADFPECPILPHQVILHKWKLSRQIHKVFKYSLLSDTEKVVWKCVAWYKEYFSTFVPSYVNAMFAHYCPFTTYGKFQPKKMLYLIY